MNCHEVKEKLSEYVDGMLPRTNAAAVENHLDDWADCKGAYETPSAIMRRMSRMGAVQGALPRISEDAGQVVRIKIIPQQSIPDCHERFGFLCVLSSEGVRRAPYIKEKRS